MGTLIVANIYEFNHSRSAAEEGLQRRQLFTASSLLPLAAMKDEVGVALPFAPSKAFLTYLRQHYRFEPKWFVANAPAGDLSKAAVRCRQPLMDWIRREHFDAIVPWGYTQEFCELAAMVGLKEPWRDESVPAMAVNEKVAELDTKRGSHTFLKSIIEGRRLRIGRPEARFFDSGEEDLLQKIESLLDRWPAVIVKPNRSWGGRSTFVIRRDARSEDSERIISELSAASWHDGQIVVEKYIGEEGDQRSPSLDVVVSFDTGRVENFCLGEMYIRKLRCLGTRYGRAVVDPVSQPEMHNLARLSREQFASFGYRGWFDVDFLVAEGEAWATEVNVRMTGGTVPLTLMSAMYGERWPETWSCASRDQLVWPGHVEPDTLVELVRQTCRQVFPANVDVHLTNYDVEGENTAFSIVLATQSDVDLFFVVGAIEDATVRRR